MKIADVSSIGYIESERAIRQRPILVEDEGPRWLFSYDNYHNDPRPDILLLGAYTHPSTENNLVGGVNLHYLTDDHRYNLARALPKIMSGGNLKERYRIGRAILPDIFTRYYRTYDAKYIRGVQRDVMYPKYGFAKTMAKQVKRALGKILKTKKQRAKDVEPKYPADIQDMHDELDQVVLKLQQQAKKNAAIAKTPEADAASKEVERIKHADDEENIERAEDEPIRQLYTDIKRKKAEEEDDTDPRAELEQEYEQNIADLEEPEVEEPETRITDFEEPVDDIEDLSEAIVYYSPIHKRYIIESYKELWLHDQIYSIRGKIANAAQKIYDDWEAENDSEYGGGGICDDVSSAIADVLDSYGISWIDGGHDGDDHSYVIAYSDDECYIVDIPPELYETGGGYSWRKIPNVRFTRNDVNIIKIQRPDYITEDYVRIRSNSSISKRNRKITRAILEGS